MLSKAIGLPAGDPCEKPKPPADWHDASAHATGTAKNGKPHLAMTPPRLSLISGELTPL
jgi:hypothetical protein